MTGIAGLERDELLLGVRDTVERVEHGHRAQLDQLRRSVDVMRRTVDLLDARVEAVNPKGDTVDRRVSDLLDAVRELGGRLDRAFGIGRAPVVIPFG